MDDWKIEGEEPKVKHLHGDDWTDAEVRVNASDHTEYAHCACGADITLGRDYGTWILRPR